MKIDSQVEVIAIGTDKHVPIPEFYEETIEVIDRELPGTVKDSSHITNALLYNFERLPKGRRFSIWRSKGSVLELYECAKASAVCLAAR